MSVGLDLEECWADLRPPKIQPPDSPEVVSQLWLGLLYGGQEITYPGYKRQLIASDESSQTINTTFPQSTVDVQVDGVGVYTHESGGHLWWSKGIDAINLGTCTTLSTLIHIDTPGGVFINHWLDKNLRRNW